MKLTKTGYKSYIKEKKGRLEGNLAKIQKFRTLSIKNKTKLYQALIRSVIEYPPIPIHAMRKTNIKQLQIIQNKSLRYIYNVKYPELITNEELHERSGLPSIQELLNQRAKGVWERVNYLDIETNISYKTEEHENIRDHYWFARSLPKIT